MRSNPTVTDSRSPDSRSPDSRTPAWVHSPVKYSLALILLALAYCVAGWLGLYLAAIHSVVSAIWPAAAVAISALALFGLRLWPGVWVGAFLVFLSRTGEPGASLIIACGNTAASVVGAWFLRRFGGASSFDHPSSLVGFFGATGLLASSLAATVGTSALAWAGLLESGTAFRIWLTWWVGDAVSIWLMVPLLVLGYDAFASSSRRRAVLPRIRRGEIAAALLALMAATLVTFGGILPDPYQSLPTGFFNLPLLFWLSMRFGSLGATLGLNIHSIIAIWGTRNGHGAYGAVPDQFILLQLYLAVRVFFFQLLAVMVSLSRRVITDLRTSEQRIQEIIQSLPGVVWESWGDPSSADYKVTFVSDQSERMLGFTPHDWLSRPDYLWGRIHPDDQERVKREAVDTFAGKGGGASQYRILDKEGRFVEVETRMAVMRDLRGAPVGMRGFNLDVTDRVKSEKMLQEVEAQLKESQKMEAVGRLAGGVAHDFNNLLTTIIGYSDLLEAGVPKDGPLPGYAREIRAAGAKAADLTRRLLTFSRQDVVQTQVLDLNGLVAEKERWMFSLLGEGIRLGLTLEPGPLNIKMDPHHLEGIIFSLLRNAREAMPRGGVVKVETSFREEPDGNRFYLEPVPGPQIVLSVIDTGIGIPQEDMPRLFEPFFTTKGHVQSVGLGLPTVYGIVKRYGGGIRVESTLGKGTRFEVFLPAHGAEAVASRADRAGEGGFG